MCSSHTAFRLLYSPSAFLCTHRSSTACVVASPSHRPHNQISISRPSLFERLQGAGASDGPSACVYEQLSFNSTRAERPPTVVKTKNPTAYEPNQSPRRAGGCSRLSIHHSRCPALFSVVHLRRPSPRARVRTGGEEEPTTPWRGRRRGQAEGSAYPVELLQRRRDGFLGVHGLHRRPQLLPRLLLKVLW